MVALIPLLVETNVQFAYLCEKVKPPAVSRDNLSLLRFSCCIFCTGRHQSVQLWLPAEGVHQGLHAADHVTELRHVLRPAAPGERPHGVPVDEQTGNGAANGSSQTGEWLYLQRRAHDDEEVSQREVREVLHEVSRELFPKKDDVWLDHALTSGALGHFPTHHIWSEVLVFIFPEANGAGGRCEGPVSLHQHLWRNPCQSFQAIDVLRVHAQQLILLVQQANKVVRHVGLEVPRIQLFGQGKERVWVSVEKVDLEYGLGVRQVVLLQVVVEATAWRPEIRDATGSTDPGSGHHHHPLAAALLDAPSDVLQSLLLSRSTAAAATGEKPTRSMTPEKTRSSEQSYCCIFSRTQTYLNIPVGRTRPVCCCTEAATRSKCDS